MATLSRKTMGVAIGSIARWSQTSIQHFLFENDIPNDWVLTKASKLGMVLHVFKCLEQQGDYAKIVGLIEAALPGMDDESRAMVAGLLLRDGFVVAGHQVVDASPETEEHRSAVSMLLERHQGSLDIVTLSHHLEESEELFRQGRWGSSIAHCRNFVEQLLSDIACFLAASRKDSPIPARPRQVRDYLQGVGFFDDSERKKLVDGIYGYFSEEGSHPGISTHSAARVSRGILMVFAIYVLEKFEAWKKGGLQLS